MVVPNLILDGGKVSIANRFSYVDSFLTKDGSKEVRVSTHISRVRAA